MVFIRKGWNWTESIAEPFPECNGTSALSCNIPAGFITYDRMVALDYYTYGNGTIGERLRHSTSTYSYCRPCGQLPLNSL